ncbi:MAG TPA: hypothetical protein EYQ41_03645, partial [Micavibrio sp.]|nr:hypothetical protein [Micavibrio sp.]
KDANLTETDLSGAEVKQGLFVGANLTQARLTNATLSQAILQDANLAGANLAGAELTQANFKKASCPGTSFSGAELTYADFSHADLTEADLGGATLFRAVLHQVQDEGASFTDRPSALETDPELAQVGMTEAMARDKHGDSIKVIGWKLAENDRAIAEKRTDGMIKVITDKKGRILGASIVAPQAGEMIGLWGLAISEKLKIGAIANMIAPYPTFGEISKRAAGSYYTASLFSDKTRFLTSLLRKLPL